MVEFICPHMPAIACKCWSLWLFIRCIICQSSIINPWHGVSVEPERRACDLQDGSIVIGWLAAASHSWYLTRNEARSGNLLRFFFLAIKIQPVLYYQCWTVSSDLICGVVSDSWLQGTWKLRHSTTLNAALTHRNVTAFDWRPATRPVSLQ